MSHTVRVMVICSGNICRSPMGEIVLRDKLDDAGIGEQVRVRSAGTGDWHVGEPADHRTVAALAARGYDGSRHRAAWFDPDRVAEDDLLLVADRGHLDEVTRAAEGAGVETDIRLIRSFDPAAVDAGTLEVDDPYFGDADGFAGCLAEIEAACDGVVEYLRAEVAQDGEGSALDG